MTNADSVTMIGGGIMGSGIGQAFLQNGYEVVIRDIDEDILKEAEERIESGNFGLDRAVEGGYLSEEEREDCLDRVEFTTDLEEAVAETDMIIEAVPEDLTLKGRVFREIDEVTDDVPLYTNTSGFSIASLGNALEDPSRLAGAHFFNPAQIMNLIEVVEGDSTDQEVVDLMMEAGEDIDKVPIHIQDSPGDYGFVTNRLWGAMRREAEQVVEQGIATEEQVNVAMVEGRNLPVGPFEGAGIGEEWGGE